MRSQVLLGLLPFLSAARAAPRNSNGDLVARAPAGGPMLEAVNQIQARQTSCICQAQTITITSLGGEATGGVGISQSQQGFQQGQQIQGQQSQQLQGQLLSGNQSFGQLQGSNQRGQGQRGQGQRRGQGFQNIQQGSNGVLLVQPFQEGQLIQVEGPQLVAFTQQQFIPVQNSQIIGLNQGQFVNVNQNLLLVNQQQFVPVNNVQFAQVNTGQIFGVQGTQFVEVTNGLGNSGNILLNNGQIGVIQNGQVFQNGNVILGTNQLQFGSVNTGNWITGIASNSWVLAGGQQLVQVQNTQLVPYVQGQQILLSNGNNIQTQLFNNQLITLNQGEFVTGGQQLFQTIGGTQLVPVNNNQLVFLGNQIVQTQSLQFVPIETTQLIGGGFEGQQVLLPNGGFGVIQGQNLVQNGGVIVQGIQGGQINLGQLQSGQIQFQGQQGQFRNNGTSIIQGQQGQLQNGQLQGQIQGLTGSSIVQSVQSIQSIQTSISISSASATSTARGRERGSKTISSFSLSSTATASSIVT